MREACPWRTSSSPSAPMKAGCARSSAASWWRRTWRASTRRWRESPFDFLRGTYWRWAETILEVCPDLAQAPPVLAVGDIHLENFGTWRDVDGRLVWGVNDFDEAAEMPFAIDLVRLATSALLARPDAGDAGRARSAPPSSRATDQGLETPNAIVLDRDWAWLRELVVVSDKAARQVLEEDREGRVRARAAALRPGARLRHAGAKLQMLHRTPDRRHRQPRTAALDRRCRMARRAGRARGQGHACLRPGRRDGGAPGRSKPLRNDAIARGRFRANDPWYRLKGNLLVRRLSPNNRKLEAEGGSIDLLTPDMLRAMGLRARQRASGHRQPARRNRARPRAPRGRLAARQRQARRRRRHAATTRTGRRRFAATMSSARTPPTIAKGCHMPVTRIRFTSRP